DKFSKRIAEKIVDIVGSITGTKRPTHSKGKYLPSDVVRAQAEITTLCKARDLIRTLIFSECKSEHEKGEVMEHLRILLDRLVVFGIAGIPRTFDLESLGEWAETNALVNTQSLKKYVSSRKLDLVSLEKLESQKKFMNPKKRGEWLDRVFGGRRSNCPSYAIDPSSGARITDPDAVKKLYIQEGSAFLRNKLPLPDPFEEKEEIYPEPVPLLQERKHTKCPLNRKLPRWWTKMYNRQAKGIPEATW